MLKCIKHSNDLVSLIDILNNDLLNLIEICVECYQIQLRSKRISN